jgi:hypothetical protein
MLLNNLAKKMVSLGYLPFPCTTPECEDWYIEYSNEILYGYKCYTCENKFCDTCSEFQFNHKTCKVCIKCRYKPAKRPKLKRSLSKLENWTHSIKGTFRKNK